MTTPTFNIAAAFRNKGVAMRAAFLAIRDVTTHPTTRGDESEADWVGLISDFLPSRYTVGPIFAVDHRGNMSEQIDVAVYDTHFSPQWFGAANTTRFVPVESVYAAFEVKPAFSSKYIAAARQKVATVRSLERTSQAVAHKGGVYTTDEIAIKPIIGGLLTTRAELVDYVDALKAGQPDDQDHPGQPADPGAADFLNIGICLDTFVFDYTPTVAAGHVETNLTLRTGDDQLIHFAIRLFRQLQAVGTVPAVDMERYESSIFNDT